MAVANIVTLVSSDGQEFPVDLRIVAELGTLRNLLDAAPQSQVIPALNVRGRILETVIQYYTEYLSMHVDAETGKRDAAAVREHCSTLLMLLTDEELADVFNAANFLDASILLDNAAQYVADQLKGKTREQIRDMLGLTNDFTPEEEAEIVRQTMWAFDSHEMNEL